MRAGWSSTQLSHIHLNEGIVAMLVSKKVLFHPKLSCNQENQHPFTQNPRQRDGRVSFGHISNVQQAIPFGETIRGPLLPSHRTQGR